jgi:hypothetical protein
MQYKNKSLASD